MEMPLRFVDDEYTPRLWAELYPVLRNIKTDELARKMLAYKNKPVESWRADDWGLLDKELEFYYQAQYPGEELADDEEDL